MYIKKHIPGFTLIELLVVISIIGLLSSIVFTSLSSARASARDARRLSDIRQIQTALELYYADHGAYPITTGGIWGHSYYAGNWENGHLGPALDPYLPTLPVDPQNEATPGYSGGHSYTYYADGYGGAGRWYMLVFTLEKQNTALDATDGAQSCTVFFDYGGNDGYIITKGTGCQ